MKHSLLIIVSGFPCTGKTTLGRKLAKEFSLPLISRDDIKETLFDTLGTIDRAWSKKLGAASYSIMYKMIEVLLKAHQSIIVESNFNPDFDRKHFCRFKDLYPIEPIEIACKTERTVLIDRFIARSQSGERHPGHLDEHNSAEFQAMLGSGDYTPLNLGSASVEVDTTDVHSIQYDEVFRIIQQKLEAA